MNCIVVFLCSAKTTRYRQRFPTIHFPCRMNIAFIPTPNAFSVQLWITVWITIHRNAFGPDHITATCETDYHTDQYYMNEWVKHWNMYFQHCEWLLTFSDIFSHHSHLQISYTLSWKNNTEHRWTLAWKGCVCVCVCMHVHVWFTVRVWLHTC